MKVQGEFYQASRIYSDSGRPIGCEQLLRMCFGDEDTELFLDDCDDIRWGTMSRQNIVGYLRGSY